MAALPGEQAVPGDDGAGDRRRGRRTSSVATAIDRDTTTSEAKSRTVWAAWSSVLIVGPVGPPLLDREPDAQRAGQLHHRRGDLGRARRTRRSPAVPRPAPPGPSPRRRPPGVWPARRPSRGSRSGMARAIQNPAHPASAHTTPSSGAAPERCSAARAGSSGAAVDSYVGVRTDVRAATSAVRSVGAGRDAGPAGGERRQLPRLDLLDHRAQRLERASRRGRSRWRSPRRRR